MQDFSQALAAWQPFFITVASVSATLAGLLFVAVSLHPMSRNEDTRANLRRLAQHTFTDFVQVLFIGVLFAMPGEPPSLYGLATALIVILSLRELAGRVLEAWRDRGHGEHRQHFIRRAGLSVLGRAFLCLGGATLVFNHGSGVEVQGDMTYVFSGSLVLLLSAMRNAWFLLLQEMA